MPDPPLRPRPRNRWASAMVLGGAGIIGVAFMCDTGAAILLMIVGASLVSFGVDIDQ